MNNQNEPTKTNPDLHEQIRDQLMNGYATTPTNFNPDDHRPPHPPTGNPFPLGSWPTEPSITEQHQRIHEEIARFDEIYRTFIDPNGLPKQRPAFEVPHEDFHITSETIDHILNAELPPPPQGHITPTGQFLPKIINWPKEIEGEGT